MEKKIYVPKKEELYQMQDMGVNMYNYLLAKVIELLILEGIKYPSKGILITAYKYFKENPEIAYAICSMYPKEITHSEIAQNEVPLCLELLTKEQDNSIYKLDDLVYFTESTQMNLQVMRHVIYTLAHELQKTPKYRFEYTSAKFLTDNDLEVGENILLNAIFSLNLSEYQLSLLDRVTTKNLMDIEPAYIFKIDEKYFNQDTRKEMELLKSVHRYLMRYGISNIRGIGTKYKDKDVLTNPDENTKRLIRYIEKNRNLIY